MVNLNKLLLPASFFLFIASSPFLRAGDSHVRIVRISYTEGNVELNNQKVTPNMPVIEGNVLTTGRDSFAEVEFEDGSTLRLAPETQVTVTQLARSSSGEALSALDLDAGEIECNIAARTADFSITARNKTMRLTRSARVRILTTNSDPLELAVWKGEATVHDPESGQDVAVGREETFTLAADDPQQYDLEKGVDADGLDQFCEFRDQELARDYVSTTAPSAPASTISAPIFVDPCQPYNWYPGLPQTCYSPFFFYPYVPGIAGIYVPFIYFHHHHHHPPLIHPPTVTATAVVHGSFAARGLPITVSPGELPTAGGTKRPVRIFNDENFKRSAPASENEAKVERKPNQANQIHGTGEEPRHAQASKTSHSSNSHHASSVTQHTHASRPSASTMHSSGFTGSSSSAGSSPHSSGGSSHSSGTSSGSSSHSSSSSSGSSGRSK